MKTISFITPCFNDGDTIEKLIKSLIDQDLPDIEIIVVNDGSSDNSKMILDGLKEIYPIKVIHFEHNRGACVARNEGAKIAQGKYFSFLPADAILYPGVARIWYNHLEENPNYDFLYGGYRLIDEDGEPMPGQDYFFRHFDPYLLEVTNYIDGSFPIRAESFWKYSKIMNQKDGLWDPNVKSLQDWDFWLSVVKNGGKGLYVQDIFFGTTPPHPGGLSQDSHKNWLERTEYIKRKHNIPIRKLCVASLGAGFHAQRIAYILNADFKEMPSFKQHRYDALYVIGFYPEFATQQDQMFLNDLGNPSQGRTAAKKIVHFVGSDVWQLYNVSMRSLKFWQEYFRTTIDVLLCESEFIQKELKELGIDAKVVPIPPAKLFEIKKLPKIFTVACYQPKVNEAFYNPKEMREIVKLLPEIQFKFFGNPYEIGKDKDLSNLEHAGYITDMESFIGECSAIMRFPLHDGLSISLLEFMLAGRYALTNVPVEKALYIKDLDVTEIANALRRLKEHATQKGEYTEGSDYWRVILDHEKYKATIKKLADYEPKEYWENRAASWGEQAKAMKVETEEVKEMFDKVEHKSVIDIGCGDGRWYPILKEWDVENYLGCDISENLIKAAQFRFPHAKDQFFVEKVEDLTWFKTMFGPYEKKDLIFSYTCFEHIKDEDFPKAVEAIKKIGKKLLLIEPINFISRYYCYDHDYEKYFNVIERKELSDKVILLCDLTK